MKSKLLTCLKNSKKAEELDAKCMEASEANNAKLKTRIHGMIWTNDKIRHHQMGS